MVNRKAKFAQKYPAVTALREWAWPLLALGCGFLTVHLTRRAARYACAEDVCRGSSGSSDRTQAKRHNTRRSFYKTGERSDWKRASVETVTKKFGRAESQFLASMSHELRTPLNAILGFAQMLEHEYFGSLAPKQREYILDIEQSARHLLSVISNILELSRMSSGSATMMLQPVDVEEICRSVIAVATPLAHQNGNRLYLSIEGNPGVLTCDPTRLRQCLLNLLGNACKFTERGKVSLSVRLRTSDGKRWIDFAVADTGIGISEESRKQLFRVYSQADPMISQRFGGSGLGLALTAQIASLLGGSVDYDSRLGDGSTFTLTVPLEPPRAASVAPLDDKPLPLSPAYGRAVDGSKPVRDYAPG